MYKIVIHYPKRMAAPVGVPGITWVQHRRKNKAKAEVSQISTDVLLRLAMGVRHREILSYKLKRLRTPEEIAFDKQATREASAEKEWIHE